MLPRQFIENSTDFTLHLFVCYDLDNTNGSVRHICYQIILTRNLPEHRAKVFMQDVVTNGIDESSEPLRLTYTLFRSQDGPDSTERLLENIFDRRRTGQASA